MRSDPGIFGFLTWLRVDEPREQSLAEALQTARERFPRQGEPDVSLVMPGQPPPGPAGSCHDRVHRHRPNDHQHAADHAGLARPEAHRGRRPRRQGHLRARGRSGAGKNRVGRRRLLHPRRPPEAHPAVPRHHLRLLPGPDARGAGLPARHVGTSRATAAKQRGCERALEGARGTGGLVGFELQIRHLEQ